MSDCIDEHAKREGEKERERRRGIEREGAKRC